MLARETGASSPSGNEYTGAASLAEAINAASLGVTATNIPGAQTIELAANAVGAAGNLALSTDNPSDV